MTDGVAAGRHSRPAPQCRSYTISCRYMPQSPAVLIHVAMVAWFFSFLPVQGVARLEPGSLARAALVPPRLRPRCCRRLLEARYCWLCPRSVFFLQQYILISTYEATAAVFFYAYIALFIAIKPIVLLRDSQILLLQLVMRII
jgi:hypothetical protein